MSAWLFDALLAGGLLVLGWLVIASAELFSAVILFMVFGLLMALCWARLAAPDVALAEAAIGAGVTGALLLNALRSLAGDRVAAENTASPLLAALLALLCGLLAAGLGWVLLNLPPPAVDLNALARQRLPESGVSNPVTAVLLNFRGYDTLLEVLVLLLALIGLWTLRLSDPPQPGPAEDSILLDTLLRWLIPPAVLIAAYLLWVGAHAPGGAFQAGTVLAAVGVLLILGGRVRPTASQGFALRLGLVLGLGVFGAVAVGVMLGGGALLQYPLSWAGALLLAIETAMTLSIALILTLLFCGAAGLRWSRP